ncbi:hypothetical protein, partial [Staphylococcus haemolyticus]
VNEFVKTHLLAISLGFMSQTRLLIKNYNPKIYNKSNNHAPNKINRMSNPMNKYKFLDTCPFEVKA